MDQLVDGQFVLWRTHSPLKISNTWKISRSIRAVQVLVSPRCHWFQPRWTEQHTDGRPAWSLCTPQRNTGWKHNSFKDRRSVRLKAANHLSCMSAFDFSTVRTKFKTISIDQLFKPKTYFNFSFSLLCSLKSDPKFYQKSAKNVLTLFLENNSFIDTDGASVMGRPPPAHLLLRATQAAADHVGLQLGSPTELHRVVVPGQPGLPLPVYHQHEPDHSLPSDTDHECR